ncbi:unnamed protein product [Cylindrotheca closterium]|uniref:EngB-type G domain-containing protein n=1 Tax=Cylindrotheca closterium TaxID=2856 RepID=A0AAD2G0W4_9STRA|nr:unnamed protein product [Cylindrotheca closterium]
MKHDHIIILFFLMMSSFQWKIKLADALLLTPPSSISYLQSTSSQEGGYQSNISSRRASPFGLQPLYAARRSSGPASAAGNKKKKAGPTGGGGGGGGPTKKKKKSSGPPTNKKGNPKKTRKTTKTEKKREKDQQMNPTLTSSSPPKQQQPKKQPHVPPPWQVVSKKDMARNVQAEKKRRKLAKEEGLHNVDTLQQEAELELELSQSFLSVQDKALVAWKRFKAQPRQDQVEFVGAYLNKQLPPTLGAPEVAFLGRSNVGKSSLLNRLVQSDQARVGKTPGATASVNLYGLYRGGGNSAANKKKAPKCLMGLVDLPGFGYAKLSKDNKEAVQMAAERYLAERKELMLGILLVDIRRVPSDDDKAVLAALYDSGVPIIVVATKVDKITSSPISTMEELPLELEKALYEIQQELGLPEGQPLCVSSTTGEGIKDLWRIIMEACEGGVAELRTKLLEQGAKARAEDEQEKSEFFDDGEDVVYNQGYDWIQDSASVMYEDEYGDSSYNVGYAASWDEEGGDGDANANFEDGDFDDYDDPGYDVMQEMPRKSLKEWRQQADEMERRGQL